jgi:hypothetical protein
MNDSHSPFRLETELEQRIATDAEWQEGAEWGRPRHGHPEGSIKAHIAAVLRNVDDFYAESPLRAQLRLIALVHDTFKFQVETDRPRTGENHHAMRARRFAERYVSDPSVLDVIELHDEAYDAWQNGSRDGKWDKANGRALALIERLGDNLPLYLAFYRCDNTTEGKQPDCLEWFHEICRNASTGAEQAGFESLSET